MGVLEVVRAPAGGMASQQRAKAIWVRRARALPTRGLYWRPLLETTIDSVGFEKVLNVYYRSLREMLFNAGLGLRQVGRRPSHSS